MKDFSTIDNTSGSFPNVLATDSSGPTLRDGTPNNATVRNDIWGAFQAVLNAASITPSGALESASASDFLDAMRKISGAPGELVWYAGETDTLTGANVLPLKGQAISISAYGDLVDATYIGDANNSDNAVYPAFYKSSDSGGVNRDTSGDYFKLPDARGLFVRALQGSDSYMNPWDDEYRGPNGLDSSAGSYEPDAPGHHTHIVKNDAGLGFRAETQYAMLVDPGRLDGDSGSVFPVSRTMYYPNDASDGEIETAIASGHSSAESGEVRPYNIGFWLGIRY